MEKRHIGFELTILDSESELSPEELLLIKEAEKARAKAYAPYSRFSVGAAVMMETGEIIMGNNQYFFLSLKFLKAKLEREIQLQKLVWLYIF